jgi:hypothetical protein
VSLDGRPTRHDEIRGSIGAFNAAVRGLHYLQEAGIRCGIITCVTRLSLVDVPWLYELACAEGASLFQMRPLALTGRAAQSLNNLALNTEDAARLSVVASLLNRTSEQTLVQCDLVRANDLATEGPSQFAILCDDSASEAPLSELVNPLVIAEDGSVRAYVYGACNGLNLTTVGDLAEGVWMELREAQRRALASVLTESFARVGRLDGQFVDWYAVYTQASHRSCRCTAATVGDGDGSTPTATRVAQRPARRATPTAPS